jgi:hypothetical protein
MNMSLYGCQCHFIKTGKRLIRMQGAAPLLVRQILSGSMVQFYDNNALGIQPTLNIQT